MKNRYRDISDIEIQESAQRIVKRISEKYSACESSVSPSPGLWDRIEQSIDRREKKHVKVWIGRIAAAAAIFCVLIVGAYRGFGGEVNADIREWRFTIIDKGDTVKYSVSSIKDKIEKYKLNIGYIPEEYTFTRQIDGLKGETLIYSSNDSILIVLAQDISINTSLTVFNIEDEKTQVLEIKGFEAYYYTFKRTESKLLVMVDTNRKIIVSVDAPLDYEEMIKIAESITVEQTGDS